jgi:hypothetical protein
MKSQNRTSTRLKLLPLEDRALCAATWQSFPGAGFHDLAIGRHGELYAVAAQEADYFRSQWNNWGDLPGAVKDIAVDPSGNPWVVGTDGVVERWSGGTWKALPGGGFDKVVVGPNWEVYALAGHEAHYFRSQWNNWGDLEGAAVDLEIGPAGELWKIDTASSIQRWMGPPPNYMTPAPASPQEYPRYLGPVTAEAQQWPRYLGPVDLIKATPPGPRDLRGYWSGQLEQVLRDSAPNDHQDAGSRYAEIVSTMNYDPRTDSITFYAVVKYRKRTLWSVKDSHMVWKGTLSLRNPDMRSIQMEGPTFRDYDPIGELWSINQRVALGIATFFSLNADRIRSS